MGMFDRVYFSCPHDECDGLVEFQSKAGACILETISPSEVPPAIALDIVDDTEECPKCERPVKVRPVRVPRTIRMETYIPS